MAGHPIFITSILARSGTNYLANLLRLHPHCRAPEAPFFEDFFLKEAGKLVDYAATLESDYAKAGFPRSTDIAKRILHRLGGALVSLLEDGLPSDARIVTKTPLVFGAEHFRRIFPEAHLVVLIRDGRSVVRSYSRSFGVDVAEASRRWNEAAIHFLESIEEIRPTASIVRYEQLASDPARILRQLLPHLDLDAGSYPFDNIASLAVIGSSELSLADGAIDWEPVRRPAGFDPARRFRDLSGEDLRCFVEIAGESQERLGDLLDAASGD